MKYIISGGKRLNGTVKVSGNKNSIFPVVAAAILTTEEVILENISEISDSDILFNIIKKLGIGIKKDKNLVKIKASQVSKGSLPDDLVTQLRGSIVLAGAVLARVGKVSFHHPGGDIIGQRSIETHLEAFKKLGAEVKRDDLKFTIFYKDFKKNDCVIFLDEASVTACENLILASSLGRRKVIIKNCPKETHILDLCKILIQMGARIDGVGSDTLTINGVDRLSGTRFRIGADCIEIGTYIIAAAITSGEITITSLDDTDLDPILTPLKRFGVKLEHTDKKIRVFSSNLKAISKLVTNIWPGFPTDLMSVAIVLSTQSKGVTLCHDWMYESRMFFVDKLISMGAKITLADPHRVFVYGPTKLKGRVLETPDIRAGMALVLAALVARGKSIINQAELIERGYEDVVEKLKGLGADIERES